MESKGKKEKKIIVWAVSSCGLGRGLIRQTFSLIEALEREKGG